MTRISDQEYDRHGDLKEDRGGGSKLDSQRTHRCIESNFEDINQTKRRAREADDPVPAMIAGEGAAPQTAIWKETNDTLLWRPSAILS